MKKIKYPFPKAHAVSMMTAEAKLIWYMLNYPNEYKLVYKMTHGDK